MFRWFFDLQTKGKLILLSSFLMACTILVAAAGCYATMSSISASENITSILNRSFQRTYTASTAMQKLDADILDFLSQEHSTAQATRAFVQDAHRQMDQYLEFVAIMNPQKIGDLNSDSHYQNSVLKLKSEASDLEQRFNAAMRGLNEDKYAAFQLYLANVRPILINTMREIGFLNQMQIKMVIELSHAGASTTPLFVQLGVTLIALALGLLFSKITWSYFSYCMKRQHFYINQMQNNNFDFKISLHYKDDFGVIVENMQVLRDKLNSALAQVQSNMRKAQDTFANVSESSMTIVQNSEECKGQTFTVAAASEQMAATNQNIARNCEDASSLSNDTKKIILDGVKLIQHSIEAIHEQGRLIQANAEAVEKVSKQSQSINAIVSTIENIASQTNLLALNAAIEAARAGEAGRGFAVVADEVRKLAEKTMLATQDVNKAIDAMQHDTLQSSTMASETNKAIEEMASETQRTGEAVAVIQESVTDVSQRIQAIATAAAEQSSTSATITTNVGDVSAASQSIVQAMEAASQGLRDVHEQARTLTDILETLRQDASSEMLEQ